MPGLERETVLHHGLDRVAVQRSGKFLGMRFLALDHRHRHHVLGDLGINIEHPQHFFLSLFVSGVRGVAFLPQELGGPQEHAGPQLPANDVGPLIDQHGKIPPALNPLGEEMPDDGLRGRPDHVGLFELLAAGNRDHRQLGRKSFHVLGFLLQETLRDQQREIHVLVAGGLETVVELALQQLPDGIAVGFDDHAAFDDFGRFRQVALKNHVLIPGREIGAAKCDR